MTGVLLTHRYRRKRERVSQKLGVSQAQVLCMDASVPSNLPVVVTRLPQRLPHVLLFAIRSGRTFEFSWLDAPQRGNTVCAPYAADSGEAAPQSLRSRRIALSQTIPQFSARSKSHTHICFCSTSDDALGVSVESDPSLSSSRSSSSFSASNDELLYQEATATNETQKGSSSTNIDHSSRTSRTRSYSEPSRSPPAANTETSQPSLASDNDERDQRGADDGAISTPVRKRKLFASRSGRQNGREDTRWRGGHILRGGVGSLVAGQEHIGRVVMLKDYGAFVDIGIDRCGLIHRSEISFKFVDDMSKFLFIGQTVRVLIIAVDYEANVFSCSLRMATHALHYKKTVWLGEDWGKAYGDESSSDNRTAGAREKQQRARDGRSKQERRSLRSGAQERNDPQRPRVPREIPPPHFIGDVMEEF